MTHQECNINLEDLLKQNKL